MILIWDIFELIVNCFEVSVILVLLVNKLTYRYKSKLPLLLCGLILIIWVSFLNYLKIPAYITPFIMVLVFFIFALQFLGKSKTEKLFWSIISISVLLAVDFIVFPILIAVLNVPAEIFAEPNVPRFIFIVSTKMLVLLIFILLSSHKKAAAIATPLNIGILCVVAIATLGIVLLLIEYCLMYNSTLLALLPLAIAATGQLLILLLVYILYSRMCRQAEQLSETKLRLLQSDIQLKHSTEISILYHQMRGWRHDYKNHLQVINGLISMNQHEKALAYLNQLDSSLTQATNIVYLENEIISALINSKLYFASQNEIACDVNVSLPPTSFVSDMDMCTLLGNLLDNAIEACQHVPKGYERELQLIIQPLSGNLYIFVKNSMYLQPVYKNRKLVSPKKGSHHGIGIGQINRIVEKYNAHLSQTHENATFETEILIPPA